MTKLTKEQFTLLEDFGLHRIDNGRVHIERLRLAVHQMITLFPFALVEGMEEMVPPEVATKDIMERIARALERIESKIDKRSGLEDLRTHWRIL